MLIVCVCGGGCFSDGEAPSPAPPPEEDFCLGNSGGEAASLREAPLPQTPSPEERLAFELGLSSLLVPPVRWAWLSAAWLRSRRLTEPPRPAYVEALLTCAPQGPKGWRGRSESPRLASAEAKSPRRMVAAALSAAVTSRKSIRKQPQLSGGTNSEKTSNSNANRSSGGSAREGLLSEKPPPSHTPIVRSSPVPHSSGGMRAFHERWSPVRAAMPQKRFAQ